MKWTQPWYAAYGLIGMVILGVAPILVPLTVEQGGKNGATLVGLVVAAFYAGGLFAPAIGAFADRKGLQRAVFLWAFPIMAIAILGFSLVETPWVWVPLAMIFGGGGSVAGTVAGLFIVEAEPEKEWNNRLSWFRLAYGAGQVVGLVIAAIAASQPRIGWIISAAILATGFFLGRIQLPRLEATAPAAPSSHSRRPRQLLATVRSATHGKFGAFLVTWLLTMTGVQTFFNVVPLIMRDGFGVAPSISSLLFLLGAAIGTALYPFAGVIANHTGPGVVLLLGVLASTVAFGLMGAAYLWHLPGKVLIGCVAMVVATVAYSFEVVAATLMVVQVTPGPAGTAMGLLNAIIALGAVIGAILPSYLAAAMGYGALPALACGVLIVAAFVGKPLYQKSGWDTTTGSPSTGKAS